jgi:hypothetical protein
MATTPKTPHHRPPPNDPTTGRGYVSPLGGQVTGFRTNMQLSEEKRNRAQSPIEAGRHPNRPARKGV